MTSSLVRRRRLRRLDEEERRLWEKVAETVEPLEKGRRRAVAETTEARPEAAAPPAPAAPAPSDPTPRREPQVPHVPHVPKIVRPTGPKRSPPSGRLPVIHVKHAERLDGLAPAVPAPPSLAPIDQRTRRRLVRGTIAIDERLDLHGLTQAAAQSVLRRFLISARARGARIVLVITGKGKGGPDPSDRGILRRAVPHWLSEPALRELVVGFEEAHLAHGGAGAIYVRLRRARGNGEGRE